MVILLWTFLGLLILALVGWGIYAGMKQRREINHPENPDE